MNPFKIGDIITDSVTPWLVCDSSEWGVDIIRMDLTYDTSVHFESAHYIRFYWLVTDMFRSEDA